MVRKKYDFFIDFFYNLPFIHLMDFGQIIKNFFCYMHFKYSSKIFSTELN